MAADASRGRRQHDQEAGGRRADEPLADKPPECGVLAGEPPERDGPAGGASAVITWLAYGLMVVSGVIVVLASFHLVRNAPVGGALLGLLGILEVGLIAQLLIGVWRLSEPGLEVARFTFVGYLGTLVLLPPATALWSAGERSRAGIALWVGMGLLVPFLILRCLQIWSAGV